MKDINDIDILLIVHPKNLSQETLFAKDQYILKGGRTIICVDPHCFADDSNRANGGLMMGQEDTQSSDLNVLLKTWGLEMPKSMFAGDIDLAERRAVTQTGPVQQIIGLLDLRPGCFNKDNVITAQLNEVRVLFSGVLNVINDPNQPKDEKSQIERTPLIMTTDKGNSFSVTSPYELSLLIDPSNLMKRFVPGTRPVTMGYLLTGRFKSSFPNGIEVEADSDAQASDDPNQPEPAKKQIKGLTEAQNECAVTVFADVDFISDILAYQNVGFGMAVVADNSALLFNTIDDLSGSTDLISVRSRGNFKRPFLVVDEIEKKAEAATAGELDAIDSSIAVYNAQLQRILSSAQEGEEELIGNQINQQRRALEEKIYEAQKQKRLINMTKYEKIDSLGIKLQRANTIAVPAVILLIAIVLWIWRSFRKRHYISHTSDA